jgi:uridine kinase
MALRMPDAPAVIAERLASRARARSGGSLIVALSGIDGSGKSYTANLLHRALERRGIRTALVRADDWLSPPRQRFGSARTGRHFFENAMRFDAMFGQVVRPLRRDRRIDVTLTLGGPSGFLRRQRYRFSDVDIVLLEGIFLLRRELLPNYDRTIWIDCTFRTALERALRRDQEGLSPEQLDHDYRTIYFPAQHLHATRDAPRERAGLVLLNDHRLVPPEHVTEHAASAA